MQAALSIGFGSSVLTSRMISIFPPDSAPIKRLVQQAKEAGLCIDATHGRKARSVILCDSQVVVLSAIQAETLMNRLNDGQNTETLK